MSEKWKSINTVPNNVFDVLAKKWDAALDTFIYTRFANCVQVDGEIIWGPVGFKPERLVDLGYRPIYWMNIPDLPKELKGLQLSEASETRTI